mgnify:CR=1 FL=1
MIGFAFRLFGQDSKETFIISGLVRYDAYFDTYESYTSRNGDVYLYPKRAQYDPLGKNLNRYNQLNMFGYDSKLNLRVDGYEILGAKTFGFTEIDFEGRADGHENSPRLRHAYITLEWSKTKARIGQYWHTLFVTECYPEVLVAGAGAPFNPFNRSTQFGISHKISRNFELSGVALTHFDMTSKAGVDALKNSAKPDFHTSMKFTSNRLKTGMVAGIRYQRPRIKTDAGYKTQKQIANFDIAAYANVMAGSFRFKIYGIYGQDLTPYVMLGGIGASQDPDVVDDFSYGNINTIAIWSELVYKVNQITVGVFGGYTSNVSTSTKGFYISKSFVRNADIDYIYRLAPRVV